MDIYKPDLCKQDRFVNHMSELPVDLVPGHNLYIVGSKNITSSSYNLLNYKGTNQTLNRIKLNFFEIFFKTFDYFGWCKGIYKITSSDCDC